MLSSEVYTTKQQLTVNVYGSRLLKTEKIVLSFNDNDITIDQCFEDKKIIKEHVCDFSQDDQLPSYSPTQCSSAIVDGELVMTTNQPCRWPCSRHSSTIVYKYCREELGGYNDMGHLCKSSEFTMKCVFCHGECWIFCTMMEKHYQRCVVAKRNIVAAIQEDCTFNINCIAVQESFTTQ